MLTLLLLALLSCGAVSASLQTVPLETLRMERDGGLYFDGEVAFSGYAVTEVEGQLVERVAFSAGRRHGDREQWYPDGTLSALTPYTHGRRDGVVQTWWRNGNLRTESRYVEGVAHGIQRQWYEDGALFKEMNLNMNLEEGLQRAWRPNGAIYNNYEARDGRIYGLRRSKLCFQLTEEEVVSAK